MYAMFSAMVREIQDKLGDKASLVDVSGSEDPEVGSILPVVKVFVPDETDDSEVEDLIIAAMAPTVRRCIERHLPIPSYDIIRKAA